MSFAPPCADAPGVGVGQQQNEISIDAEFRALIPPPTHDELVQLEENLRRDGCLDPLVVWRGHGLLLDGHNRYEICLRLGVQFRIADVELTDRDAAQAWIIRNQFGRRNLTPFQRAELAMKLEPLIAEKAKEKQRASGGAVVQKSVQPPVKVQKELARAAGISHDTIHKAKVIAAKAPEQVKQRLRAGEVSINAAYRDVKKAEQKAEKAKAKETVPSDLPAVTDRWKLYQHGCSPLAVHSAHLIGAASADWIITDPPYPKDNLDCFGALADFAAHALKPGGSLLVMVGQSYLPEVMRRIADGSCQLRYHWSCAYLTPGGQSVQLWDRKVNTFWKPLLWYVNGDERGVGDWVGDVCRSDANDNDKRFHGWGQSESGMGDIIERFTYPGQLIVDPFLGGGTTGIVAVQMGRTFIGLDIDADAIEVAKRRFAALEAA